MLIVDDEPIICRGLGFTIPWEEYEIEVIGLAHDGEEAILKVEKHKGVDIVITDIRMPKKDGLQLAAYLTKHHPQTKIIMISGYDEFKYAQRAIQLGVKDYLLKPVNIDELLQVVQKITSELSQSQDELRQQEELSLRNLIYHQVFGYPIEQTEDIKLKGQTLILPFISMRKNDLEFLQMQPEEIKDKKLQWKRHVESYLARVNARNVSVFISENMLLTLIMGENELSSVEQIKLRPMLESNQLFLLLTDHHIELKELSIAIQHLKEKVNDLPINSERIVYCSELEKSDVTRIHYPEQIEEDLVRAILKIDQKKIAETTKLFFDYLESNQFLLEEAVSIGRKLSDRIVERLKQILQKEAVEVPLHFHQDVDVLLVDSYDTFRQWFLEDIEKVIRVFALKQTDNKDWLIERALEYIKIYYKSDIKAHEVADVVNITPNYFSSIFKQKTGKNFNEYVNHMRVEEAKTLLEETPFKVSEISVLVGFHEYKYFVEVFGKFSGMTPTQYRKFKAVKEL